MPQIGPYTLHTIDCGRFRLDGGAMFGIIPQNLWARRMPPDQSNRIRMCMRCLLLEGNDQLILIDTGAGDKYDQRFRDIYALETYPLTESIHQAGFHVDEITDVILTHLHFDHAGGSTQYCGDHRVVPTFPNAIYHLQCDHLSEARNPNVREHASFFPENFGPLLSTGQLATHSGSKILYPGIEVIVVNGHTTAQQLVKIIGEQGTLLFCADLLPTIHHLRGPWIMAYDVRPLVTITEKFNILNEAYHQNWHLFFEHDPDVEVASVQKTDGDFTTVMPRMLRELF